MSSQCETSDVPGEARYLHCNGTNVIRLVRFATEPVCNPTLKGPKKGTLSFMAAFRRKRAMNREAARREIEEARRRPLRFFRSGPGDWTTSIGVVRVDHGVSCRQWQLGLRAAGLDLVQDEHDGTYVITSADDPRIIVREGDPP